MRGVGDGWVSAWRRAFGWSRYRSVCITAFDMHCLSQRAKDVVFAGLGLYTSDIYTSDMEKASELPGFS